MICLMSKSFGVRIGKMIKIALGLMDNIKTAEVSEDTTVQEAFEQEGFDLESHHKVQKLDGTSVDFDEDIEEGETYIKVEKMKPGYK